MGWQYRILEQGVIVLLEEGDLEKIIISTGRVTCQQSTTSKKGR